MNGATTLKKLNTRNQKAIVYLLAAILLMLGFLFSILLMSQSMLNLSGELTFKILDILDTPVAAFSLGMLLTTLLQRSSATSSLAVVACSTGAIDLHAATLMIFGANIGTTITSDLVAMSHIFQRKRFRDAFGAALVHDSFNLLTALILLPLEIGFSLVSVSAKWLTDLLGLGSLGLNFSYPLSNLYQKLYVLLEGTFPAHGLLLFISLVLMVLCLLLLKMLIQTGLKNRGKSFFELVFGRSKARIFSWGLLSTALFQSSSLTTSMSVLFAGSQKISVRQVYPFMIGANLGTTLTALLAALALSETAITVAVVHIIFNLFGLLAFFASPWLSQLPVNFAERFSKFCSEKRSWAFAYLLMLYFFLPLSLLYFSQWQEKKRKQQAARIEKTKQATPSELSEP